MDEFSALGKVYAERGFGCRVGWGRTPAVLVIDLTIGFTDPTLPLGADLSAVIAATNRLLAAARERQVPILFTSIAYQDPTAEGGHWIRKIPSLATLRCGSRAVEIDPRLARRESEPLVYKHFSSAFVGTDLGTRLRLLGVDTLVICGTSTSGCIRASVTDAVQSGFRCIVPAEGVGDRGEGPHRANLFDIDAKYGDVLPLEEALSELVRVAGPHEPVPQSESLA